MRKYYFFFGEGSKINQIICAVLINMAVFSYGAMIGWMSPMTYLLQSENSPRDTPLTDAEVSSMASVAYLICVPANFFLAFIGDRIGRKYTLMFMSMSAMGCWIIKLSSMETWAFILARSLVSISMAGGYVICPLYIKEISEDSIRGFLGSLVVLFHTTGNLFLYIIGDMLSYRTVLWVCLAFPLVQIILFSMMPDSPSFLVKKGRHEEAAKVLAWLRCRNKDDSVVQQELDIIRKQQITDEESSKYVLKAVLTDKILFRAFRIAMVVTLARDVCGAIPVLNFAADIFEDASEGTGLVLTPNQQAMMLGAMQVAGPMLTSTIIEKTGRKPLLIVTSLVSGLSMCVLASWFLARSYEIWAPAWLPITTLCLCIFCDYSGLAPVSILLTGEMFSYKYRGVVLASAMASSSVTSFLQMLFFKPLASMIGVHIAFYFFGFVCLAATAYVILVVPETKQRSLEDIHFSLRSKTERAEALKGIKAIKEIEAKV